MPFLAGIVEKKAVFRIITRAKNRSDLQVPDLISDVMKRFDHLS